MGQEMRVLSWGSLLFLPVTQLPLIYIKLIVVNLVLFWQAWLILLICLIWFPHFIYAHKYIYTSKDTQTHPTTTTTSSSSWYSVVLHPLCFHYFLHWSLSGTAHQCTYLLTFVSTLDYSQLYLDDFLLIFLTPDSSM